MPLGREGAAEKDGSKGSALHADFFVGGQAVPSGYTCNGSDVSPSLLWSHVPKGTRCICCARPWERQIIIA